MAIFQTIIKAAAGAFGHWQLRIAFGDRLATERCSGFSHLEVDDVGEAGVVAAFAGKLSTRQPTGLLQPSEESIEQDVADAATLTLYLEPSTAKVDPEWQALSAAIARCFESNPTQSSSADGIGYLIYRNIDMASARAALCQRIKTRRPRPAAAGCDDALWRQFVSGQGQIAVQAGDVLGLAGPPYLAGTPANRWQCAVGLRTRFGMFDLGTFYSAMTSTSGVQPPADAAALAARLGPRLPLIDAGLSVDAVGADRLWPWPALVEYKRTRNLPYSQWRRLGDLQKQKYRAHLLARVRPGSAPPNTLPFDFDVDDIAAGRAFIAAYVDFFHFAEGEDHGHGQHSHRSSVHEPHGRGHHGSHD